MPHFGANTKFSLLFYGHVSLIMMSDHPAKFQEIFKVDSEINAYDKVYHPNSGTTTPFTTFLALCEILKYIHSCHFCWSVVSFFLQHFGQII